jgi:hypothetical protein
MNQLLQLHWLTKNAQVIDWSLLNLLYFSSKNCDKQEWTFSKILLL